MGCACALDYGPDWGHFSEKELQVWRKSRDDFHQFADYLREALGTATTIEIYIGEEYWFPPLTRRGTTIDEMSGERFEFNEREYLILRSS